MQSGINAYPFSVQCSGKHVLTGYSKVAQESRGGERLGWPTLGWLLQQASKSLPFRKVEQSHAAHTQKRTALAQIYTKLMWEELERKRLGKP